VQAAAPNVRAKVETLTISRFIVPEPQQDATLGGRIFKSKQNMIEI